MQGIKRTLTSLRALIIEELGKDLTDKIAADADKMIATHPDKIALISACYVIAKLVWNYKEIFKKFGIQGEQDWQSANNVLCSILNYLAKDWANSNGITEAQE